jgi:hypothetical protein
MVTMVPDDGVAQCRFALSDPLGTTDHRAIIPIEVGLLDSPSTPWHFGPVPGLVATKDDGGVSVGPGGVVRYTITVRNVGQLDSTGVEIQETVGHHQIFDPAASDPRWVCVGDPKPAGCTLPLGDLEAGAETVAVVFAVQVDPAIPPEVVEIANLAVVRDDTTGGLDPTPTNNQASDRTPVTRELIFASGFETGDTSEWSMALSEARASR